jgi:hypothetical protein
MATKNKFRKLSLGPSDPITRRTSVQGMQVVADYLDPITNQRTLLLERIEGVGHGASAPAIAKPVVRRKRKARAAVAQPTNAGSQTAFPGAGVTNGA